MKILKCDDCSLEQQKPYQWVCTCGGKISYHEAEPKMIYSRFALMGIETVSGKPFLQLRDVQNDEIYLVSPGSLKKIIKKRGQIPVGDLNLKEYRGTWGDVRWNVVKGK